MATIIDGTDSKYVKADIEVYKYGFLMSLNKEVVLLSMTMVV